jgi:hypothetical protein
VTSDLAMEILTALPLDIGAPWGKVATRWQIDDPRAVLDFPMLSTARGKRHTHRRCGGLLTGGR